MRTLVLSPESPVPAQSGLPLRILHLARQLTRARDVDLAALAAGSPPADVPFHVTHLAREWHPRRALTRSVWEPRWVAETQSRALRDFVRAGRWDAVQGHGLPMVRFALAASAPVIFDAPDVLADVAATLARADTHRSWRPLWSLERIKTARFERSAVRAVTAVTTPSDADAAAVERLGARRVTVVENGVDVGSTPYRRPAPGAGMLLVGYFRWRPNALAAHELVDHVLPRVRAHVPDATVTLVGKDPSDELLARAGPDVAVTGRVDDVLPYLRSARVAVLPIRAGGGTRIKALEALAAGVPVVATPFAVAGLGLRDGTDVLLGRTARDLAGQAVRVIEDDALALALSRAGRKLVERRFDWSRTAEPLLALHDELPGSGRW